MGSLSGMPGAAASRCGTLPYAHSLTGAPRLAEGKGCLVIAAQSRSCHELAVGYTSTPKCVMAEGAWALSQTDSRSNNGLLAWRVSSPVCTQVPHI